MQVLLTLSDPSLLPLLADGVRAAGFEPRVAASVEDAYHAVARDDVGVLVCDDGLDTEHLDRLLAATQVDGATFVLMSVAPERLETVDRRITDLVVGAPRVDDIARRVALLARRRAERQREMGTELLSVALDAVGDIVEITDPSAVIQWMNPAFTEILGFPREDAIGRTPAMLVRSDMHEPGYFQRIDRALASGETWRGLLVSRTRDGRLVHLEATIAPVRNAAGAVTNHVAVKRDITARIETERELRSTHEALERARDAALEASRAKSQFLANMSHELRTPLNAIIGYSEMLTEEAEDIGEASFVTDLSKIRAAGTHLLGLIDQVLDISKIEAGRMELYLESFEVEPTLRALAATLAPLVQERGNELVVEVEPTLGVMRADLTKLRQTLLNLLSNANKFTERGRVTLRARGVDDDDGSWLVFDVQDSGIGMEDEQLERIFSPFEQADASTTRKYGGTGLGLAISQKFCELMRGAITVTSAPGVGSTFTVRLPRQVRDAREDGAVASQPPGPADRTILVIDDDPTIHDLLIRFLGKRGFRVECVSTGPEGLALARTLVPDLIVLDVMMPGMDGWATLTALKKDDRTHGIPVVMLTMVAQSEVGFALGANDYMLKPVEPKRLVEVIRKHCPVERGLVLVVEDDAPTREIVRRTLEGSGFGVIEAENGRVGLELLAEEAPDLIVLDLMMPEVDGFEFLQIAQASPAFRDIPVVVATAKALTSEERAVLEGKVLRVVEKGSYSRRQLLEVLAERVRAALGEDVGPDEGTGAP